MRDPVDQELDDLRKQNAWLKASLALAPRPDPKAGADWMVVYMDWYFTDRAAAMDSHPQDGPVRNAGRVVADDRDEPSEVFVRRMREEEWKGR